MITYNHENQILQFVFKTPLVLHDGRYVIPVWNEIGSGEIRSRKKETFFSFSIFLKVKDNYVDVFRVLRSLLKIMKFLSHYFCPSRVNYTPIKHIFSFTSQTQRR